MLYAILCCDDEMVVTGWTAAGRLGLVGRLTQTGGGH